MPINWIQYFEQDPPIGWQVFYALINHWFGGLEPLDGIAFERINAAEERLGAHMPETLQELYLLAGARDDLLRAQNRLLSPEELFIDAGRLVVWSESQSVVTWGIPLDAEGLDPRVEMNDGTSWVPCNEQFSQFATQMLLMDLYALSDHGALAFLPPGFEGDLSLLYDPLPLPVWPWPQAPTRFLADLDTVVILDGSGSLYGSSRTAEAHDRLVGYLETHGVEPDMEWTE